MNHHIRQAARQAIAKKGWTQNQLAERVGIKQATVSRVLTGERRGDPETWQRILDALGLELTVREKSDRTKP